MKAPSPHSILRRLKRSEAFSTLTAAQATGYPFVSEKKQTVPVSDCNHELPIKFEPDCAYVRNLISEIGEERFIQANACIYARDDEALTWFNLAYDEAQEEASAELYWRSR